MSASTAETVTAIAAVAAATAASIQVIFLIVAAWFTRHQLTLARDQLREAQTLRAEQTRPFVVVDFHASETLVYLTIENLGKTLAKDVEIQLDEPLTSTLNKPIADLAIFTKGIPSLPPGKRLSTIVDSFPARIDQQLQLRYDGWVTYIDEREEIYEERIALDLRHYVGLTDVRRDDIHHVSKNLEEIKKELRKWTASGGSGMAVLRPADVEERWEAWQKARDERIKGRASEPEPPADPD